MSDAVERLSNNAKQMREHLEATERELIDCRAKHDHKYDECEALKRENERLRTLLLGAGHALRSYQYGNKTTDLAEAMADEIDASLQKVSDE